ncbi:MAG: glycosyltransferase family 2 protein [Patescibacteria group bacterium]
MGKTISIIVPIYNEAKNLPLLSDALKKMAGGLADYAFEFVMINDGSTDESQAMLERFSASDERFKTLEFSRNFGKEMATSAGLKNCSGEAAIMIDADLQHPIELIPEFIKKWEAGNDVIIGIRQSNQGEGVIKKFGSYCFYKIINKITDLNIIPAATDFRLVDRQVIDEFNKFQERNRMTRALIDWLGYRRGYINFQAKPRLDGRPGYSFIKLLRLAINSFISLSLFPLKLAGYLGIVITVVSGFLGLYILLGKYVFYNAFAASFSGPAQLAILTVFLVGIILICLGLIALYIAHIHDEVLGRPLYVIRKKRS